MPYPGTKNKDRNAYGYRITDKNSGKKCGETGSIIVCIIINTCGKPVEKELDNNNMIEHIESGINAKKLRTYSIGKHCAIQANQCSDQVYYLIVGPWDKNFDNWFLRRVIKLGVVLIRIKM